MSRENVELLRRAYEAGATDSAEASLEFVPPDVVWYLPSGWLERSQYHGPDGVREALAVFTENFDDYRAELEELRDAGDSVVGLYSLTGRVKGSGTEVRQRVGAVYSDFREGGLIGKTRFFFTWEE